MSASRRGTERADLVVDRKLGFQNTNKILCGRLVTMLALVVEHNAGHDWRSTRFALASKCGEGGGVSSYAIEVPDNTKVVGER